MASIYDRMALVADRLLSPADEGAGKFGQGLIEFVRYVPGVDPVNPWDAPTPPTYQRTTLKGAARGVSKELVGTPIPTGGQIVSTDLAVIVAPFELAALGEAPDPTDTIEIDGKAHTILSVSNIPPAGTVVAVRFVVRA